MDEEKPRKLHPLAWSGQQRLMAVGVLLVVVVVVVVVLRAFAGTPSENGAAGTATQPIVGSYNICEDDKIADKPLSCHPRATTVYPSSFLRINRNSPERCWIEVDGYVYNVSEGSGYKYPGPNKTILDLCGLDASDRFKRESVNPPPPDEYLVGQIR